MWPRYVRREEERGHKRRNLERNALLWSFLQEQRQITTDSSPYWRRPSCMQVLSSAHLHPHPMAPARPEERSMRVPAGRRDTARPCTPAMPSTSTRRYVTFTAAITTFRQRCVGTSSLRPLNIAGLSDASGGVGQLSAAAHAAPRVALLAEAHPPRSDDDLLNVSRKTITSRT